MQQAAPFEKIQRMTKPARLSPLAVRLIIIVVCLNTFVLAISGLSVYTSRQQYYVRAEIMSRNVSAILAETVSGYIARIESALLVIVDEAETDLRSPSDDRHYLLAALKRAKDRVPHALLFRVTGPDGVTRLGSDGGETAKEITIADRDYFKTLRDHPDAGLAVSQPLKGRLTGEWVIVLARRITDAEGRFAGVAYASMAVKQVSDLFSSVDLQQDDAIALRAAGHLGAVARFPELVAGEQVVGNPTVSSKLKLMTMEYPDKGTYITKAPIDGIERVLSYHKVGSYPFYLVVGVSTQSLMGQWLGDAAKVVVLTLVFMAITIAGSWWMLLSLQARQALEGRLRLIEFAVDHAAEAVLLLRSNGQVVYGNAAASDLFQRSPSDLRQCLIWDLGSSIDSGDWQRHWQELAKGEPVTVATGIRRSDDSTIPVVVTANYLSFGEEEFDVSIIRDIRDQLRHENDLQQALAVSQELGNALARKNDELARFTEILAHHMKEPVRHQHIIAQRLARVLQPPLPPDVQQSIDFIVDAATRHLALLRDAQRYLSIEQSPPATHSYPGDAALDRALEHLRQRINAVGATINRHPLPELPIDTQALAEVFLAVIDNAITYTRPDVPPRVQITADLRDGEFIVSITDNGIGIPVEYYARVFRVFEQLEPRPGLRGTGIGLPLAKKIIESQGGRMWIEQPVEPGTRICFALPVSFRPPGGSRS